VAGLAGAMADRKRWGTWLSALAAVLVLAGLLWFGDVDGVVESLRDVSGPHVAAAFAVVTVAYALRFAKWHLFVRTLGLPVGSSRSLQVFLAGLMMVVTPAKVGEVWKSVLLSHDGIPVARSLPAVGVERLLDLLAVGLLGAVGLALLLDAPWAAALVVAAAVLGVAALRWTALWHRALDWAARRRRLARPAAFLRTAYDGAALLLRTRTLGLGGLIGLTAWTLEGAALWLVLEGLGANVTLPLAIAAFCIGTMAGVISFLPGGLGTAEAGMVAILVAEGVPDGMAAAATILARVATLGYGAAIGAAASLFWPGRRSSPAAQDGGVVDPHRPGGTLEEPLDRAQRPQ
jgi:glycosyltransferase 2 family protein